MASRNQPPHDETTPPGRSPVTNDIDPDGMDPEREGDAELDAGAGDEGIDDVDVEPDGARDTRRPGAAKH